MRCHSFCIWGTVCALRIRPTNEALSVFRTLSSSVVHVPGVNDIQSSSSTGQNLTQISRQLNQGQVAWTGNRPPFPGQVPISSALFSWSLKICTLCAFYRGVSEPLCNVSVVNLWLGWCWSLAAGPWQVVAVGAAAPRVATFGLGWCSLRWQPLP